MCMPTSNVSGFGYSWFTSSGELTKGEVETPSSLSYTLGNTVTPETTLTVMSHKSPQVQEKVGTVVAVSNTTGTAQVTRVVTAGAPGTARRAMFVLNEAPTINRVVQQNQTATINNETFTAANLASKPFMTPIGPIQLTAEECNEILMKRALQAQGIATPVIDASQLNHTLLNGTLKTLTEANNQQTQVETIQTTQSHQQQQHHQLLQHTKQEPGTANNSPKTVYSQTELLNSSTVVMSPPAPAPTASQKERPYSCDECGKSFLLKHHLTTHARVHTGERPHVCAHCGKAFARKHCLNTHLLLHSADRPYRCHECKMAFTLKHHLVTHSRVHSRDRPFVCGECGRGFPLKRHLVTHSKYHAGERPYVCSECGESFAQKEHLVMHSRFHGSLSPFVCPDCGVAFARKFQLVNHGRVHGRVPHACPVCGKEFLQKRTLVAHMKLKKVIVIDLWLKRDILMRAQQAAQQQAQQAAQQQAQQAQQQAQQVQTAQQAAQQQAQQAAQQQAQQAQQQAQQVQTVIKTDTLQEFKPQIVQAQQAAQQQAQQAAQQQAQQAQQAQQQAQQVQTVIKTDTLQEFKPQIVQAQQAAQQQAQQAAQQQAQQAQQQAQQVQTVIKTDTLQEFKPQIVQQAAQQQAQQAAQQQAQQAQQQAQQVQTVIKTDTLQEFKPQIVQVIGSDGQLVTERVTPGYPCPECGSCFNTKEALSLHVRLHAGDRTCVTDLCALTAALQPGLVTNTQHHNAHSQWFGYLCPECGSCFNTKEALSLHVRLHAGDRTCVTDLCALTAALQPGLVTNTQHHNAHSQCLTVYMSP
ncbi:hypothetical protein NE865_01561 [Phthorimaea operculella]|nr:hypothetical protein NE865_01561 [Phthorimaea operculella]